MCPEATALAASPRRDSGSFRPVFSLPSRAVSVTVTTWADRLAAEVERKRSQLVVGLDPRPDLLPIELRGDVARFCCGIVDAVTPHAVAVKPQLAFFEAL